MPVPAAHVPLTTTLAIGALVMWRAYRRIGRLISRQRFHPTRSWFSVIFFPLLAIVLLAGSYAYPLSMGAELAGIAAGIGLAVYGLRLTRFESQSDGLYYTPNAHIGIALSLLFAGRVVYRMTQLYGSSDGFTQSPPTYVSSPVTLLIIGTLAGYYAWYGVGLIRKHRATIVQDSVTAA